MCELFLPFNKVIIVLVTTNLELARENPARWAAWLTCLRKLAEDPRSILASNSVYDQRYVQHFSGVEPLYLPTLAAYVDAVYAPTRRPFLLAAAHTAVVRELLSSIGSHAPKLTFAWLKELYPNYEFSDLAAHPAIICIPYTKSVMSFFEFYRMGIPLFYPSLEYLVDLEMSKQVMSERIYWSRTPSPVHVNTSDPDPNTRSDRAAVAHWLALSDPFVFPHVQYFDSIPHLARLLEQHTFQSLTHISARMRAHMASLDDEVRVRWAHALRRAFAGRVPGASPVPLDLDNELSTRFGAALPRTEPPCTRMSAPDEGRWN
mmetsp:Transcript_4551/g.13234  ORF Transcript_4551/g.13234 Transcript_4551/m.13234 type:complete len:318 (+) Transcript_4551:47-1000(+)